MVEKNESKQIFLSPILRGHFKAISVSIDISKEKLNKDINQKNEKTNFLYSVLKVFFDAVLMPWGSLFQKVGALNRMDLWVNAFLHLIGRNVFRVEKFVGYLWVLFVP